MSLGFAPETIEHWPIERLRPYAQNAKTHGADQVARIAASIAEFGWTVPVLVADDGEVIAGHGRILAATEPGLLVLGQTERHVRPSLSGGAAPVPRRGPRARGPRRKGSRIRPP
jgi:ParB-like nuclease domain